MGREKMFTVYLTPHAIFTPLKHKKQLKPINQLINSQLCVFNTTCVDGVKRCSQRELSCTHLEAE